MVEGSTGDGFCYKGEPKDPKYNVTRDEWAVYQEYIRKFTIDAFAGEMDGRPEIPLLLHTTDILWAAEQYEGFVTKKGVASHFYHSNETESKQDIYGPYNTSDNSLGRPVYARGEGETMWMREWFKKDSLQNLYWSAIYAIHCGLDIWNIPDHILADPRWYMALDFFDKYAGQKFPEKSPVAFCALKDELNSDDTIRFSTEIYGLNPRKNLERALTICKEFENHGAVIQDPDKCLSNSHISRSRSGYNDVGIDRIADDYNLYLYPIHKTETSVGWWHLGPKDQPYGRFARGFEHETGRDTLFFKFHKDFFSEIEKAKKEVKIRIVWLDNNQGTWKFSYDAGNKELKTAKAFRGEGSNRWKEEFITLDDALFEGNGPRGSDIALINSDHTDEIFHLIEVERDVTRMN